MLAVNFLVGSSSKTETVIKRQNPVFILTDKNSDIIIFSEVSLEGQILSPFMEISAGKCCRFLVESRFLSLTSLYLTCQVSSYGRWGRKALG